MNYYIWIEQNYSRETKANVANVEHARDLLNQASELLLDNGARRIESAIVTTVPGGSWIYKYFREGNLPVVPGLKTAPCFKQVNAVDFSRFDAWSTITKAACQILASHSSDLFVFEHETAMKNHYAAYGAAFSVKTFSESLPFLNEWLPKAVQYLWYPGPVVSNDPPTNDFYRSIYREASRKLRSRAIAVDNTAGYPLRLTGALAGAFEKLRKSVKKEFKGRTNWPMLYFGNGKHLSTPKAITEAVRVYSGQVGAPDGVILFPGYGTDGAPLARWIDAMKGAGA